MKQSIRFGILGYAGIARKQVIPAMVEARNAIPYAIASRSEEKLAAARQEFAFTKEYITYDELLCDPNVDAVYIPLPNGMHKEWTIKAAQHGKHVLCEKPLGLDEDECLEMIGACKENNVCLMEAFMYRFTTRTRKLRELLAGDAIGQIRHINSTFRFVLENNADIRVNKQLGGGSLRDIGCYPVNIIGMILGDEPVSLRVEREDFQGVDHSLTAVLKYANGAIATINCGFDSQCTHFTEINGTKGSILLRDSFLDTDTPILLYRDGNETVIPVDKCKRYVLEIEAFCDSILTGQEPIFSLEESVRNNRLIDRILREPY